MPYSTLESLPDTVKKLPKHAQEIYQSAYNSAWKEYGGDEGKSAATAWAAVKNKYKKNKDGNWVAKESEVNGDMKDENLLFVSEAKVDGSIDALLERIRAAIAKKYGEGVDRPWLFATFTDYVIVRANDVYTKLPYKDDGKEVTFSDPVKVEYKQTFEEIKEALSSKIVEVEQLVKEAGARNSQKDTDIINQIIALAKQLLNDESKPKETQEAFVQLDRALRVLEAKAKEQRKPATKTEGGTEFPAEAYAYVPNSAKPSTWKIRLWEDLTKKETPAQIGRAAAAVGPGFRGQKAEIPAEDMPAVKAKIRAAWKRVNPDKDVKEMPDYIKEAEASLESDIIEITFKEAILDDAKKEAEIVVIEAGEGNKKYNAYYPAETLARDYKVFEGAKQYIDHLTDKQERELAGLPRSIKDWVSTVKETWWDPATQEVRGRVKVYQDWFWDLLKEAKDEIGTSIDARVKASRRSVNGKMKNYVEGFKKTRSVDWVTEAGAGGKVIRLLEAKFEEDRKEELNMLEKLSVDEIITHLRESRTDVLDKIAEELGVKKDQETPPAVAEEDKGKEKPDRLRVLEALTVGGILKAFIDQSKLPEVSRNRVFSDLSERIFDDTRIKEAKTDKDLAKAINDVATDAIKAERDYLGQIAPNTIKGMGGTDTSSGGKTFKESMQEELDVMFGVKEAEKAK